MRHPVLTVLLGLLAAAPLPAQGAPERTRVRGRVTIAERDREPTRDMAEAVVWLEPVGETRRPATTPAPRPVEMLMQGRQFTPRVRVVPVGTTVELLNADPFRHNAFSNSSLGPFDLGLYGKGERRGVAPRKSGVYTLYCDIHARMRGHLVVVPGALWAQPGLDGRFEIADVAPGRYLVRAWHERGGEGTREVTVRASAAGEATAPGDEVALALDARGFKVQPHKNKFGRDYPARSGDRY